MTNRSNMPNYKSSPPGHGTVSYSFSIFLIDFKFLNKISENHSHDLTFKRSFQLFYKLGGLKTQENKPVKA